MAEKAVISVFGVRPCTELYAHHVVFWKHCVIKSLNLLGFVPVNYSARSNSLTPGHHVRKRCALGGHAPVPTGPALP